MAILRRRAPLKALALAPRGTALTAASQRASALTGQEFRTLFQPWQVTALATYTTVGECWYAAQFYARSLSKLRLFVGRIDNIGEVEELGPDDPASKLLDRVQDPGGGRAGLLSSYGRLMFLIGEAYLTATGEGTDEEKWEFLSPVELRPIPGGGGYQRQSAPGLTLETLTAAPPDTVEPEGDDAVVWRVWRRSPVYSKWADSPMQAVLLLFEELELLQLAVRARAKARSNRGLLYVSNDIDFPNPDGQGDENAGKNAFMQILSEGLLAPVKDPGAPSSVVPLVVFGPSGVSGPDGGFVGARDLIFTVPLIDPKEQNDEEKAKEAIIKRIAIGLDLPAEILTGMGDVNHWGAWQIDEASWTAHVQPMADQLVQDLSSTYLREAAELAGIQDWQDLVVGYDASDVINHPDRTNDVREAYRDGAVGAVTYRATIGLEEEDAPTPEEHQEWLDIKLRGQAQLAEVTGTDPTNAEPVDSATTVKAPPPQPTVEQIQDDESVQSLGASANGNGSELVYRIVGAAENAVERAREIAGSRIIQKARGCDDCKEKIIDVPSSMVASALGAEQVGLLTPGMILTEGGTSSFAATLGRMGVDRPVVERLSQLVENHARESLFEREPRPLPAAFADYVRRVTV